VVIPAMASTSIAAKRASVNALLVPVSIKRLQVLPMRCSATPY
jgi:hypothetical protein